MATGRIVTVTLNTAIDTTIIDGRAHDPRPGGKGINVSRALALLGTPSIATGFVGSADLAQFRGGLEGIAPAKFHVELLPIPGPTRRNVTTIDTSAGSERHARNPGIAARPEDVRALTARLAALTRDDATVVFAGSAPPGIQERDLRGMIRACTDRGARIAIDAAGDALAWATEEPLWLLKINAQELGELTRMPVRTQAEVIAAARSVPSARHVCITRGAEGAVLITGASILCARAAVNPADIVSTVGCGDALLAGVLHAWHKGQGEQGWEDALRVGVAAATATATSKTPGIMNPTRIAQFLDAIVVGPAGGGPTTTPGSV